MKKRINLWMVLVAVIFLTFCTAQSRLGTRLAAEWNIEKFELRNANGETTTIENAGTITLSSNGKGTQSFSTGIVQAGGATASEFDWENTAHTVTIKGATAEFSKVWILVDSGRSKQTWYSTDSEGNVQVMELRKK